MFYRQMFRRCECEAQLLCSCRPSSSTLSYAATPLLHRSPIATLNLIVQAAMDDQTALLQRM